MLCGLIGTQNQKGAWRNLGYLYSPEQAFMASGFLNSIIYHNSVLLQSILKYFVFIFSLLLILKIAQAYSKSPLQNIENSPEPHPQRMTTGLFGKYYSRFWGAYSSKQTDPEEFYYHETLCCSAPVQVFKQF